MESFVTKIVEKEFGQTPSLIEEIKGKGRNNLVFKVTTNTGAVIVRLSDRNDVLELYKKEAWCTEVVQSREVPAPQIIKIGSADGYAFSVQEFVEGTHGTELPEKAGEIWFTLGQHACKFHEIDAPDYKIDYRKMVGDMFADDYFVSRDICTKELSEKIQHRLEETFTWKFSPKLCHGNLHPSNVIVGADGTVHLIDWETATGNKVPEAELAEIYTWNNGKENIAQFLHGYGLSESGLGKMMRDIQTLVLLRLVQVIVRKMPKDNNWKNDTYIEETAIRLASIKDYSQNILFTKNL